MIRLPWMGCPYLLGTRPCPKQDLVGVNLSYPRLTGRGEAQTTIVGSKHAAVRRCLYALVAKQISGIYTTISCTSWCTRGIKLRLHTFVCHCRCKSVIESIAMIPAILRNRKHKETALTIHGGCTPDDWAAAEIRCCSSFYGSKRLLTSTGELKN